MLDDVLLFRCQNNALRLSVLLRTVRSRMSKHCARASKCKKPPASSRSELVMVPDGLLLETSLSVMYCGHSILHTTRLLVNPSRGLRDGDGNQIPPAPLPEASWWPLAATAKGMSSANLVR